jgi:hypothetical protein
MPDMCPGLNVGGSWLQGCPTDWVRASSHQVIVIQNKRESNMRVKDMSSLRSQSFKKRLAFALPLFFISHKGALSLMKGEQQRLKHFFLVHVDHLTQRVFNVL